MDNSFILYIVEDIEKKLSILKDKINNNETKKTMIFDSSKHPRLNRIFKDNNIEYLEQLSDYSRHQIYRNTLNVGKKTLDELEELLCAYNIMLRR